MSRQRNDVPSEREPRIVALHLSLATPFCMKTAYLDCFSGVAGDMFLGALLDLGADFELVRSGLDSMGLDYVELRQKPVQKNGFRANQLQVVAPSETTHRGFSDIAKMIRMSSVDQRAKDLAEAIFRRVATAEAHVHGFPSNRSTFMKWEPSIR